MGRKTARIGALAALALALALAAAPNSAVAPMLMMMIKQIAQEVAQSTIKDALLSGLSGMGCKGIALSNALAALDLRGGGGTLAALRGMPQTPTGLSMPGMPAGMGGLPGGMTGLPGGMALGGLPTGAQMPSEMAAKMAALMPGLGQVPPGLALEPDQMAMFARLQQAMAEPLSPVETLATIDELTELGFLPKPIQTELKECMALVPAALPALGMGMGMLKPMVPQLRQARAELHALSPAEQDEVAATLVEELKGLPADQRGSMLEHLDSGFFPARIAVDVKAKLRSN